jgi:uncharacterized membrane protein YozB (DUF420 family)
MFPHIRPGVTKLTQNLQPKSMYQSLLIYHNLLRWLVLASLLIAIFRAYKGYSSKQPFSKTDNVVRHWTATIAHIQLMVGMVIYFQSPLIKYFWTNFREAVANLNISFFGLIHITLMFTAIMIITIGSALTKRRNADNEKFRTMLVWFSVALILIIIAVPWPFSPLATRPYIR